ncbi:MAG: 2-hydroxyglutaryl-CoA dehydratase [Desulfobacterales bacterium]|nr:2-hydroxyglutaryl-CoA dehydratase [Desulfobacterales bacterium]
MIFAGCDIGSLTSKAVLMKGRRIIGSEVIKSKTRPEESAEAALAAVLEKTGVKREAIVGSTGTGYGRGRITFADHVMSEIACHARGAKWLHPSVRTVIDIGGQDAKVLSLDKAGVVLNFKTNDKCAAGTGRFLEVMANVLNVDLEEMGTLSLKSTSPVTFAATCTVWAQADAIKYLNSDYSVEDIAAGINKAMANRVAVLASSVGVEKDVCMTGGVAKNKGVVSFLEKLIGVKIKKVRKADPQLAGAIGAALYAMEKGK